MKGIILAGGSGTRLYPLTKVCSKQLLPIYDKPMIFYSMSTLMLAGIRDILIISTPTDTPRFKELLGDGSNFGVNLSYAVQESPDGLAQAFIIGEEFIGNEAKKNAENGNATIFGYYVKDPERFGIVEFDENKNVLSLEEKPQSPKSNYCITGLYFYPAGVATMAKKVKPSARGELEITDLNRLYLNDDSLKVQILGRGFAWMDTGTMDSLMEASIFIQTVQNRQGVVISAPEEIAYHEKWISKEKLLESANAYGKSPYGEHLKRVAEDKLVF